MGFIATKEHRRFCEFATAVRKEATIGICHGDAGVGKTQSARRYAHWNTLGPFITEWGRRTDDDLKYYAAANRTRTVFYTPEVMPRHREIMRDIDLLRTRLGVCVDEHRRAAGSGTGKGGTSDLRRWTELLIIDEAERLTPTILEILRDLHDRQQVPILFIGMPGIDKRFAHYPQLYSRLGFSHQYRTLGREELLFVLGRYWKQLGLSLDPEDFTDAQAIATIERITRGNFRLLERLFPQISRVLKINQLQSITDDVVEAAASILVIGN
ncbi:hypothetical protein ATJ88_0686 [Isoptericola jiangsuensis]|uniref:ORC1/DEAH AAA+ ATPase domain-containing protein n=1 Tax=Isoptericola jiangsuensis TaxID=548579 RepID=A0A2A9ETY5_9MICO|nr:AAA family ATPase [Isoptericola jiangsuensis]PFG42036.1 hypothetical protein ATJ88_0686 [Isoptericola jiangsuensis]